MKIKDLFEAYAKLNHPNQRVLIWADISNPARDLCSGGIEVIIDPSTSEEDEFLNNEDIYEVGIYENGIDQSTVFV